VIRVVIDTSVLIRYLIRPSAAIRELIELGWLDDEIAMVTWPELLAELVGVLARDYIQDLIRPEEGQVLLDAIALEAEVLPSLGSVPSYTRDPKDDKFVACALAGEVEYLVTVDQDLLALESLGNLRVVTPEQLGDVLKDTNA
jgi:putative PIN family toxin of toxin-antitoxin system